MHNLERTTHPDFENVIENYPENVRTKMLHLRKLVLEVAQENAKVPYLEETLKWGEPSFVTKYGSTLRMDWKNKNPNQYAMYFKCTSKLVETFKMVFEDCFTYEKNRAIVFTLEDKIPTNQLKECIAAALTYHKVKHLTGLGMQAEKHQ